MRIAILTTFYKWDKAYSLTSVVENQLLALVKHGYAPILFVHDNFNDDDKVPQGVEIRKVIPRFLLVDYSQNLPVQAGFWEQAQKAQEIFEEHLKDIDICLTHDFIFQGWFLIYNVAIRKTQEKLPNIRWFHWIHSAPSARPENLEYPHDCRYKMMPNSKLIYMNNYDVVRLAEMYGAWPDDVRVVHNPLDPRSFLNFHPLVSELIDKYKLLDADIIDIYPVSSTRFDGKQVSRVIQIMGELKKLGKSVRFICPNAHANGDREKKNVTGMMKYAEDRGLMKEEVIFTSFEDIPTYEHGVPNEVVRDLFLLSNLFVFPTLSENCPLILLEAALAKCLLVLNDDFPPLKDFFGEDALYFKFSSLTQRTSYANEEAYFADVAKIILAELRKNKPLNAFAKLKQKYNYDYIFKNELEPLFFESWATNQ